MAPESPEIPPESSAPLHEDLPVAGAEIYKDAEFYFNLVTFKVENCLFRVPRHELERQSTVFHDMFRLSPAEGRESVEGGNDDNPILLDSVSKYAFKLLLKLLYPLWSFPFLVVYFSHRELARQSEDISSSLTLEQCASLLKVTHMWDFERINHIIKNRIRNDLWTTISCADKIKLAHDYEIKHWYSDAYYDLATRLKPLSVEDGWKLGLEFSIKMGHVRERVASVIGAVQKEREARRAVDEIFFPVQHTVEQPLFHSGGMAQDNTSQEKDEGESETSTGGLFGNWSNTNVVHNGLGRASHRRTRGRGRITTLTLR